MNIKTPLQSAAVFSLIIFFSLFSVSCRKVDVVPVEQEKIIATDPVIFSKFFNLPAGSPIEIIRVANDLKKQDAKMHFLTKFVEKNGVPRWDKVFYSLKSSNSEAHKESTSATDSSGQGVFLIPLQSESSKKITSYITCYKHNDSIYTYRNYNRDSLDNVKPVNDSSRKNLFNAQLLFGYFEGRINHKDSIHIKSPYDAYIIDANIQLITPKAGGKSNSKTNEDYCTALWNFVMAAITDVLPNSNRTSSGASVYSVSVSVAVTCYYNGATAGGGTGGDNYAWGGYKWKYQLLRFCRIWHI